MEQWLKRMIKGSPSTPKNPSKKARCPVAKRPPAKHPPVHPKPVLAVAVISPFVYRPFGKDAKPWKKA